MHATQTSRRRTRRVVVAVAATLTLTAGGITAAFAVGGFTDSAGRINGCVDKVLGTVRVVQPGTACRSTEVALAWNQQGAQGPAGPIGPTGGDGQKLVSFQDTSSYDEPTNRLDTPGNPPIEVTSFPSFTLASPAFVQVLGHGQMTSSDEHGGYGSCSGGYPEGMGPELDLVVDGQVWAYGDSYLNPSQDAAGAAGTRTVWLAAGKHTLDWQFRPDTCSAGPSGTTHVDQLSAVVVTYN